MSAGSAACERTYLCIDLKSFYASAECVERGLDPLTANLVVADPERTDKTICLAVSPAMKTLGVRNRCRVFEIPAGINYVMAPPRMRAYIEKSADIYAVYLRHIAKEDIHVYSIDEAFMDVTRYLPLYGVSARELGERIRADVVSTTGIPATCGMGPNLYLAKVALDITAKHSPDFFGELDEESYRHELWPHRPLTDFWRVGPGTQRRMADLGLHTMGDIALSPTEPIYRALGVDAEILIDHAWGREPVTIADIKAYRSQDHSLSSAQVLGCGADFKTGLVIVKEMADALCLQLVDQGLVASSVSLGVSYKGAIDEQARAAHRWRSDAHGTARLPLRTDSLRLVTEALATLYRERVDRGATLGYVSISLSGVERVDEPGTQLTLDGAEHVDETELARERTRQRAINDIKGRFGADAILRGIDLLPGATARERNHQIGGHRSGD